MRNLPRPIRRKLLGLLVVSALSLTLVGFAQTAQAAVSSVVVSTKDTVIYVAGINVTYSVQVTCDSDGCADQIVHFPIPVGMQQVSSTPSWSPTSSGSQLDIPIPDAKGSTVFSLDVVLKQTDFMVATYPDTPKATVSGVTVTSTDENDQPQTSTQDGAVSLPITGGYSIATSISGTPETGTGNRVVDYSLLSSGRSSISFANYGSAGTVFRQIIPAGALVTNLSNGSDAHGQWWCNGVVAAPAGNIAGPAICDFIHDAATIKYLGTSSGPTIQITYGPAFANGTTTSNSVTQYLPMNGAPSDWAAQMVSSELSGADPQAPWIVAAAAFNSSATTTGSAVLGGGSDGTPMGAATKVMTYPAGNVNGAPGHIDLSASFGGSPQTTLVATDVASNATPAGFVPFDHFVVSSVSLSANPKLAASINLKIRVAWTASDQTSGSVLVKADSTDPTGVGAGATNVLIPLAASVHVTGLTFTAFSDDGSGAPIELGLAAGSALSAHVEGTLRYASVSDGSAMPSNAQNCEAVTTTPAAAAQSSCVAFELRDALPIGSGAGDGTYVAGTTSTLPLWINANEPNRDISATYVSVVLPPGVQYADGAPIVQSDGSASVFGTALAGATSVNAPTGQQLVTIPVPTLKAGFGSHRFSIPITILATAPTGNFTVLTYATADKSTFEAFGSAFTSPNAQFGHPAFPLKVYSDGGTTLPGSATGLTIIAAGGLVGSQLTAVTTAGPWSVVSAVLPGKTGAIQQVMKNNLPSAVTNVRIYDKLPSGTIFEPDQLGSTFTPILLGVPTGVPGGWSVLYSTDDPASCATADTDPELCHFTFSTTPPADLSAVTFIEYTAASMAAGELQSPSFAVSIPADVVDGQQAVSRSVVYANTGVSDVGPLGTTTGTLLVKKGKLTIDKSVNKVIARHGDTLTYAVTINNSGSVDATDVSATDTLPAGVTYVSSDQGGIVTGSSGTGTGTGTSTGTGPVGSGQTISWVLPLVAAGANATMAVIVTVDAGRTAESLVNSFGVETPPDFAPTVVGHPCLSDQAESCVLTSVAPVGSLEIDKSVDKAVALHGDLLSYTLTIKNTGAVDAGNLVATDTLPAGLTYVSSTGGGTAHDAPSNAAPSDGQLVSWNIAHLAANSVMTITVLALVAAGTAPLVLVNSFGVTTPVDFAPTTVDHPCATDAAISTESCATTTVADSSVDGLSIVVTTNGVRYTAGPGLYLRSGLALVWQYTVTNIGTTTLNGVAALDDQLAASALTAPTGFSGTLNAGASVVFTATATSALGQHHNKATATATGLAFITATDASWYYGQIAGIVDSSTIVAPAATTAATAAMLSFTGFEAVPWFAGAVSILLLGLVLVMIGRRRLKRA